MTDCNKHKQHDIKTNLTQPHNSVPTNTRFTDLVKCGALEHFQTTLINKIHDIVAYCKIFRSK